MRSLRLALLLIAGCSSTGDDSSGSGGAMSTVGGATGGMGVDASGGGGGTNMSGSGGVSAGTGGTTVTGSGGTGAGGTGAGVGGTGAGVGGTGAGVGGTGAGAGGAGSSSCDATSSTGGGTPMIACNALPGVCGDCIWEKCCELSDLCTVDADCACMTMCIATASVAGTNGCLTTCGLTGSPPGFTDLLACAASACSNAGGVGGECSVPASFEPPPDSAPAGPTSSAGIGSGALADCSFGARDPTGSVLQLQNADGSVCVRIERRNDGSGSMANTSWTLLSMYVGPLGEVVLIDDPADVCWYSSHHNFNDWAHASSGSRHYEVKTSLAGHATTPTYTLHVFEDGPLDAGSCAPRSDGTCPIATMDLVPAP